MKGLREFVRGGAKKQAHRQFIQPEAEAPTEWTGLGNPSLTESNFVDNETPGGAVDGVNDDFTLAATPNPTASLRVYLNGVLQVSGTHFNLAGSTVTFMAGSIPQTGDLLRAHYRK